MESENTSQDDTMNESDSPGVALKRTCLSIGTAEQETQKQIAEMKVPSVDTPDNSLTCNGTGEIESVKVSYESAGLNVTEGQQNLTPEASRLADMEDVKKDKADISVSVNGENSLNIKIKSSPSEDVDDVPRSNKDSAQDDIVCSLEVSEGEIGEDLQHDDDVSKDDGDSFKNITSIDSKVETSGGDCTAVKAEVENVYDRSNIESNSSSDQSSKFDTKNEKCVELMDLNASREAKDVKSESDSTKEAIDDEDITSVCETKDATEHEDPEDEDDDDVKCINVDRNNENLRSTTTNNRDSDDDVECLSVGLDVSDSGDQKKSNKDTDYADNEKESKETCESTAKMTEVGVQKNKKPTQCADTSTDDIEIIGESKIIKTAKPNSSLLASQTIVFVPGALPLLSQGYTATSSSLLAAAMHHSPLVQGIASSSAMSHGLTPAYGVQGMSALPPRLVVGGGVPQGSPNIPLFVPPVAPPTPKSSLDQIELIRWEIQNRINTRPKYFKPNPTSELGPLAKFLFDIGSDLIKEAVYHDLVKIQSKKNNDNKLNDKEKVDLEKLKEIEKGLFATIGHLKLKLKKRCNMCNFQTESNNVMFHHKQFPHEDNKLMGCSHCSFVTRQVMAYKFHMEAEHSMQPKLHDKKAFYECDLCPYENNQEQKLVLHKQRCIKQFRPYFNLHPSCLSGAEINLCLENIFYKALIPKQLKILQQKHLQLVDAAKKQAEAQALATKKNAAAVAAKKQQLLQNKTLPVIVPRYNVPPSGNRKPPVVVPRFNVLPIGRMPLPPTVPGQQQTVRYNAMASAKPSRPTIASMLNNKQNSVALPTSVSPNAAAGGFQVCEICGGYVKDRKALRIHFFYAHRIDLPVSLFERTQAPLYCATCYVRFWTAQGLRKHIDSHKEENQTRGVVGKCILCGHQVLNLLLHMRLVHNREMQHYGNAHMCMFCGAQFGSRQECERHVVSVHGQVDPVTGTVKSPPKAPVQQQQQPLKVVSNQKKTANNTLVKGSVCVLCNLNFGRNVDLTRHCMRVHHTCMKCGMVVIDKASLMKHTCLSSPSGTRDCIMCGENGFHPAYFVKHLRDKHLKKFTIRVDKLSRKTIEKWTKCPCPYKEPEEILVEISDSDDDVDTAVNKEEEKSSPVQATSAKRQKLGPACEMKSSEKPAAEVVKADNEGQDSTDKTLDAVEEVIDLDSTREISSADEDSRSSESPRGQKRKSVSGSLMSETSPKRKKSS